jgi:putative flippase GtrA
METDRMQQARTAVFGQVARFAVTGGLVTALGALVYWVPATYFGVAPLLANFFAYLAAMISGYVLHSRWSFKGHGSRDNVVRTTGRFVWLLTGVLGGPTWWPVLTMLFVTPAATFLLNRYWVFD